MALKKQLTGLIPIGPLLISKLKKDIDNTSKSSILEGLQRNIGTSKSGEVISAPTGANRRPRSGRGRNWRDK